MADLDNIPTLTKIVHEGDEEMLNHFSADSFVEQTSDDSISSGTVENASIFENTELSEIPCLEEKIEPSVDIFTDHMEDSLDVQLDKIDIQNKIDEAILETLEELGTKLKKQLYKKFEI